jgi:hypothetical protein
LTRSDLSHVRPVHASALVTDLADASDLIMSMCARHFFRKCMQGIFLDDDISATGGFAENCVLNDCEHDMGLTAKDMQDLQAGWADMMNRTQARVLELGGFDWRESLRATPVDARNARITHDDTVIMSCMMI